MRHALHLSLLTIVFASVQAGAQSDDATMDKRQGGVPIDSAFDRRMCVMDGVAVGGYDVVSYREEDGPVRGSPEHPIEYRGATYLFVSPRNAETFLWDPERYLPAYAGFCAITLALGRVTCPDYSNFKIEDDRVLVFEVTGFTNGRTLWDTDTEGFRKKADANFERLNID